MSRSWSKCCSSLTVEAPPQLAAPVHATLFTGPFRHLALVQPRVGIGDMIWHLPHLRALARGPGRVTLVARPRSMADQFVGAQDGIDDIFWIERDQWLPEGRHQGVAGLARLVAELRARRFDAAVLMTRSRVLSFAVAAAGVRRRQGYGIGSQRWLLNRPPFLPETARKHHPYEQATAWLEAGGLALDEPEPRLAVLPAARAAARARLGVAGRFAALGIATSDAWKQWGGPNFSVLARRLRDAGWTIALVGGPAERAVAEAIAGPAVPVLGWNLRDVAAVLAEADFYVGNDTAALNIAAAVGTRAYGLFGATPVLHHSPNIIPIVPPGGLDKDSGMERITVAAVLDAIKPR